MIEEVEDEGMEEAYVLWDSNTLELFRSADDARHEVMSMASRGLHGIVFNDLDEAIISLCRRMGLGCRRERIQEGDGLRVSGYTSAVTLQISDQPPEYVRLVSVEGAGFDNWKVSRVSQLVGIADLCAVLDEHLCQAEAKAEIKAKLRATITDIEATLAKLKSQLEDA